MLQYRWTIYLYSWRDLDHLIGLSTFDESIEVKVDPNRLRPIDVIYKYQMFPSLKVSEWSPIYSFNDTMRDLLNFGE